MQEYGIYTCRRCGTGQAFPLPTREFLLSYYSGFLFAARGENYGPVLASAERLFPLLALRPGAQLAMLDIGGGGGFYAKAFEALGYGRSTYVDLDDRACDFARHIGVRDVIHADAASLCRSGTAYDFIMCRHLIEHVPDPAGFVLAVAGLLSGRGVLLVMCPNGDSLEYLAYPRSNIAQRIRAISRSSGMTKAGAVRRLVCGDMLHGMDPPRHLWAITRTGLLRLMAGSPFDVTVTTRPLTDAVYSPYYRPGAIGGRINEFFGTRVLAPIRGGTHLVAVINRKACPPQ
jgi:SAM-dependent methyltransferase